MFNQKRTAGIFFLRTFRRGVAKTRHRSSFCRTNTGGNPGIADNSRPASRNVVAHAKQSRILKRGNTRAKSSHNRPCFSRFAVRRSCCGGRVYPANGRWSIARASFRPRALWPHGLSHRLSGLYVLCVLIAQPPRADVCRSQRAPDLVFVRLPGCPCIPVEGLNQQEVRDWQQHQSDHWPKCKNPQDSARRLPQQ
jgi:hypothetical protein